MAFEVDLNILEGFGEEAGGKVVFLAGEPAWARAWRCGTAGDGEHSVCLRGDSCNARIERKMGIRLECSAEEIELYSGVEAREGF